MHYLTVVTIHYCGQELLHNNSCIIFTERFDLTYFIEELSTIYVFCYQVEIQFVLVELKKLNDTGMV
jgi:hypothetical protein